MSWVTLANTNLITVWLPTVRSWALPVSGEIGQATFTLPYDSPAAQDQYLNDGGGSLVTIGSEYGCGDWRGIVTSLAYGEQGVTVTAQHPIAMLKKRPVAPNRFVSNVAASMLAQLALQDALGGLGGYPLQMGAIAECGPNVQTFLFHGEYCWDVLSQLMDWSGAEVGLITYSATTLSVGPRGLGSYTQTSQRNDAVCFGPALSSEYGTMLSAPGQLRNVNYALDIQEEAAQARAINGGQFYTATNAWAAGESRWPAVATVKEKVDSPRSMKSRADAELDARQNPLKGIQADVPTAYWDIREGDMLRMVIPWARFTGSLVVGRVMSRQINDDTGLMTVRTAVANESADDQARIQTAKTLRGAAWRKLRGPQAMLNRGIRYRYE